MMWKIKYLTSKIMQESILHPMDFLSEYVKYIV